MRRLSMNVGQMRAYYYFFLNRGCRVDPIDYISAPPPSVFRQLDRGFGMDDRMIMDTSWQSRERAGDY